MHRIAATPGGWNPQAEGVIFIEQTPAPIVFLTAADTDIQTLAASTSQLPDGFPALRVVNLLQLQQQLTIDTYAENVLAFAQVIIVRLLGGSSYWSYGLEVVQETVQQTGAALVVLPGDDRPEPDLISHSTVTLTVVNQLWRYLTEGGVENFVNALKFTADVCLGQSYNPPQPQPVPRVGLYPWGEELKVERLKVEDFNLQPPNLQPPNLQPPNLQPPNLQPPNLQPPNLQPPNLQPPNLTRVGILFYRAHYLAGNTAPIDALCQALAKRQLEPVPIFVSSLRDSDVQAELLSYFQPKDAQGIGLLLNTTSFSLAKLDTETPQLELWNRLDVPVLQVILSGGTVELWNSEFQGLTPRDTAMNVALPEVDGRIISRAVSFKSVQTRNPLLETDVVVYEPVGDRIEFVADLAANWVQLRHTPPSERRIALILANYPNRDGRLANGVGLDTPASCIEILKALQQAGYRLSDIPETGDALIHRLTAGVTNDPEGRELRAVGQQLSLEEYQQYFETLPSEVHKGISDRWGFPFGTNHRDAEYAEEEGGVGECGNFAISGIQLGNVFVGIQPARGYDIDPSLNYHAPDLEPPHAYLAFYYWLRQHFGAQAVVHVGKHGNLEWLPGKSVALSGNCYPEVALGAMPHLYPFIVNDPGEGSQAKRRSQAVIIDHLTPPMTRAELYGPLQQLEGLIDEYYEAQSLDPSRLPVIRDRITQLVVQEQLHRDLGIEVEASVEEFLTRADGYLCELKEAQIRDGLHIFGQCPQGRQLRDLIVAIARHPGNGRIGLTRALAEDRGWDFDPLTADPAARLKVGRLKVEGSQEELKVGTLKVEGSEDNLQPANLQIIGDVIEELEEQAAQLVEQLIQNFNHRWTQINTDKTDIEEGRRQEAEGRRFLSDGDSTPTPREQRIGSGVSDPCSLRSRAEDEGIPSASCPLPSAFSDQDSSSSICVHPRASAVKTIQIPPIGDATKGELGWICDRLLPALQQTHQEITQLLRGLDGRYIPSGPSGAPTRGRPEVLPTGRNFYSVDIRAIPTETAWDVGRKAAEVLIERYTQENGEYPKTLGLSVWGTSTMRTGGDDLAEALALLGVQPVWDYPSRRVVDFEILPVSVLGHPRVDVTLRISGFFRDAFPNLISLFDQAVAAVAALDEPPEQNPLAWQVKQEQEKWEAAGLSKEQAEVRSRYRIFGSKPGAYGAGLQGLIEAQNWSSEQDLARAYINWSSYAYTSTPPNPPLLRGGTGEVAAPPLTKGETGGEVAAPPLTKRGTGGEVAAPPLTKGETEGVIAPPLSKGETEGVVAPPLSKGGLGGVAAPEAFEQRLKQMQIVLHNQDNREHDLLDSDDYYQFQGGLTVAVRALTGKNPQTYFGDNSIPGNPKVRQLREEIARVYRSRVVNPKWIEGAMRHGYKGAFEMAATVDYLFAYDATANCVEDHMYQGVAKAYLFDPKVQEFIQQKNPWALRDMAERLLEAHQRGLWKEVKSEMLEGLRAIALQAEAVIEGNNYQ